MRDRYNKEKIENEKIKLNNICDDDENINYIEDIKNEKERVMFN